MNDWNLVEKIKFIERKLELNEQLDNYEKNMIMTALRKANDITQKPYYEIVYHDEYDRQERRIMEPISHISGTLPENEDYLYIRDRFQLNFNRIEPRKRGE